MNLQEWQEKRARLFEGFKRVIGPFPEKAPLNARTISREDKGDYIQEKVVYESEPGEEVPAYLLIPKGLKGPAPAVFCHHQHNAEFQIGKSEVVGMLGNPEQAYGKELAQRGYIVLAADALCFEERREDSLDGGAAYERFIATTLLLQGSCLQSRNIWDVIRGIDYLTERPEVDEGRIGMVGHSLGGQETIFTAAFEERIKVVAVSCGFTTYAANIRERLPHNWSLYVPGILTVGEMYDLASLIAPRPFFLAAATKDYWMPVDGVREAVEKIREVYEAYGQEERFHALFEDVPHRFTYTMRQAAYAWFDRWL